MKPMDWWWKRLWQNEPVIVRGALGLAVSAGVLSVTQASAMGQAVSAIVETGALLSARAKVRPTAKGR